MVSVENVWLRAWSLLRRNPAIEIFRLVCRTLGTEPERTAMVGDRYDRDIIGAGRVGLFTVLVDVHAIPIPDGAVPPDATVNSIEDVLDVLPLIGGKGPSVG
jgi:FMN phosphatase YigB (HAD superfamily)